ncbi:hypothetical protein BHE74_00053100 [Ensete ventricosum]|nr:hypothetical protein BHE74_00053100 [Ensete ventricosum]
MALALNHPLSLPASRFHRVKVIPSLLILSISRRFLERLGVRPYRFVEPTQLLGIGFEFPPPSLQRSLRHRAISPRLRFFFPRDCGRRADSAAVAITTTDLVSKSVAVETKVITTDALVTSGQIVFPLLIAMRLFNFKRVWMLAWFGRLDYIVDTIAAVVPLRRHHCSRCCSLLLLQSLLLAAVTAAACRRSLLPLAVVAPLAFG